jgi:DNA-binding transcriptional regulator YhcF (GntR family)
VARQIDKTSVPGVAIDRAADVPVGVQLDWALCAQIREGVLGPEQQLPTLREMAEQTGLNVNTVRAVYRRLEQRGLVESHHGSGTFVTAEAREAVALSSIAAHAAQEARETGLDPREVAAALYVTSPAARDRDSESSGPREDSEADRRRSLRGQIATLERTIAELEADHPGVAPSPSGRRRGIGPALLSLEELGQVRATLIRRLAVVQAAIDEHAHELLRREVSEPAHARAPSVAAQVSASKEPTSAKPKRTPRARPSARPAPASG